MVDFKNYVIIHKFRRLVLGLTCNWNFLEIIFRANPETGLDNDQLVQEKIVDFCIWIIIIIKMYCASTLDKKK